MKHNEKLIEEIALDVQKEYGMAGLSEGLYFDFAKDVAKRYSERMTGVAWQSDQYCHCEEPTPSDYEGEFHCTTCGGGTGQ